MTWLQLSLWESWPVAPVVQDLLTAPDLNDADPGGGEPEPAPLHTTLAGQQLGVRDTMLLPYLEKKYYHKAFEM